MFRVLYLSHLSFQLVNVIKIIRLTHVYGMPGPLLLIRLTFGYFIARANVKGGGQVAWIRNLGTTCCSQFDSNT